MSMKNKQVEFTQQDKLRAALLARGVPHSTLFSYNLFLRSWVPRCNFDYNQSNPRHVKQLTNYKADRGFWQGW